MSTRLDFYKHQALAIIECSANGLNHLSFLNKVQLHVAIIVDNYVAITFSGKLFSSQILQNNYHFSRYFKAKPPNHFYEKVLQCGRFEKSAKETQFNTLGIFSVVL